MACSAQHPNGSKCREGCVSRLYSSQLQKVSTPRFEGKARKFPRYFKGHLSIGDVRVRILPSQPASLVFRGFSFLIANSLWRPTSNFLGREFPKASGRIQENSRFLEPRLGDRRIKPLYARRRSALRLNVSTSEHVTCCHLRQ
jgi:hypothetical protein